MHELAAELCEVVTRQHLSGGAGEAVSSRYTTAADRPPDAILELPVLPVSSPVRPRAIGTILVPTDFSFASARAVEQAVALANQCEAALTILHVIDVNAPATVGTAAELVRVLWEAGSARMAELAWSLSGKVQAHTRLTEGLPWEVIVEQSRRSDLIVMARHQGRNHWKPFSRHTARQVLDKATCPVLVVGGRN